MLHSASKPKGFTLLELLIVIAILAVLAAVTVVVLNPAELLARARDSQRMSDLAAIRSAISFFMVESPTPVLNTRVAAGGLCAPTYIFGSRTGTITGSTTTNSQLVDGAGWVPVNLAGLTGGSPLAAYPLDPTNTGVRFYVYACQSSPLGFALVANLESAAHTGPLADRTETRDGGRCTNLYETGTIARYIAAATLNAADVFGADAGCT